MSDHNFDAGGRSGDAARPSAGAGLSPQMARSSVFGEQRFGRAVSSVVILTLLVLLTIPFALSGASAERVVLLLLIDVAAVVGIAIYTGNSGILSIGHLGFFAIGAYLSGILTLPVGEKAALLPNLPPFLATLELDLGGSLVVVAIVTLAIGFLTGLPVSRLRNTSAIIATFGFLVIVNFCLIGADDITNGNRAFYGVPKLVNLPVVYIFVIATIAIAFVYKESKFGLQLRAFQDEEVAAAASGVRANRRLLQAWTISAAVVGLAGAMFAHVIGAFMPKDFYLAATFALVAMLVLGGRRSISGAVIGTFVVTILVEVVGPIEAGLSFGEFRTPPIWGATQIVLSATILLVMYLRPAGLLGSGEFTFRPLAEFVIAPFKSRGPTVEHPVETETVSLSTDKVGISFGGVHALKDVSITVTTGKIVGLIGPNGAGKTTLINNLTGINRPHRGSVTLGGTSIIGWTPHRIALSGLARTFQNIRLFGELSVVENVMVAASAAGHPDAGLEMHAVSLLRHFDLQDQAQLKASMLSYGAQRRLEIARALALRPRFLLLDEPAAGMNRIETQQLMDAIRKVKQTFNLGILVVEHDLHLIMRLCDEVYVLNKGEQIASGPTKEVQNNPVVIEAYLGTKDFMSKRKPGVGAAAEGTHNSNMEGKHA